jgi:hypothetical protein
MPWSDFLKSLFAKDPKKSIPLNPNSKNSDEYDEEDKAKAGSSSSLSYGSSSSSSTENTKLLSPTGRKTAIKEERIKMVGRAGQALTKILASYALGHVAPGAGGVFNVPAVLSTMEHDEHLKLLLEEPCDTGEREICQGMLAYVLTQKDRKLGDAVIKCTPVLGTLTSVMEKFHWLDKKKKGGAGKERLAQATLLVEHARECHVALAIYAEVVCKDSTKSEAWKAALNDIEENSEFFGASDQDPVNPAANKLARKLKPNL